MQSDLTLHESLALMNNTRRNIFVSENLRGCKLHEEAFSGSAIISFFKSHVIIRYNQPPWMADIQRF